MKVAAADPMRIVILGLSITSSWGNGHATTYRALVRELEARGHRVTFLERDVPWYAGQRDLPEPPYGRTVLYGSLDELRERHGAEVASADAVIVGSYVPDGIEVGAWALDEARGIVAFYDIDTPVTLASLAQGRCAYLSEELIRRYHLYLSFNGGPILTRLEGELGARRARPLHCSVDPELYRPEQLEPSWDLGYLGTYSRDRQPALEELLLRPARALPQRSFVVAGPQYPQSLTWPRNVERRDHVAPDRHRAFYNGQRFTLSVTRRDMIRAGYAPSVRLFEAAACGVPIISDRWPGLESFFRPGEEVLIADGSGDTTAYLEEMDEHDRRAVAARARRRVLSQHTAAHRAAELEGHLREAAGVPSA